MRKASGFVATLGGRYLLRHQVGSGGMGVVWEARDRLLGRPVAVKVLSPALAADGRFVERFRREARAAAGLSHANIAHIFDYGEDGSTRFIVMELVEGETLAARLGREGRLSPGEASRIGAQVADALQAAHRAGIVHRDVKPANIMLAADGGVKVMDFGIAAAAYGSSLTATGSLLGTAAYMSPEHASGGAATPASDVYSLSVVMYEALTGAPPFDLETPVATAAAHVHTAPAPLRSLAPEVPPALAAAIERGLRKDAGARPASAAAFADLLRAGPGAGTEALATAPTVNLRVRSTDPLPTSQTPPPYRRRNRTLILGVVIVGLLAWLLITTLAGDGVRTPPAALPSVRASRSPSPSAVTPLTVPTSIIGMRPEDAASTLDALGITLASIVRVDTPPGTPDGVVVATDPRPGTALGPSAGVTLFVSDSLGRRKDKGHHGHGDDHGNGQGNGQGSEGGD